MSSEKASITIETSASAAYVTLTLDSERIDEPLVEYDSRHSGGFWRRIEPQAAVNIVLSATDRANQRFRSSRHPHEILYCVEEYVENCPTLARAAYNIVARLAVKDLAHELQEVLKRDSRSLHKLSRESGFSKKVISNAKDIATLDGLELYQQIKILEYFGIIDKS